MAASKVCSVPNCPKLIPRTESKCPEHAKEADHARGTTTQRGYGAPHQALRRAWQARIAQHPITCTRCGKRITANDEWHLDHEDDRTSYRGPSHAKCNTSAGGRKSAENRA